LLADRQATTPIVEAAPRPPTPAPAVPGVSAHSTTAQPGQPPSGDRAATENEPVEAVTVSGHEGQTPAPSQAKRGPTGERIFILDADLGTTSLSLGYIVFRPVRPFAEINGVEVYEGSEVEGFTVEKIEADKVTLRDADGPLVLRVP
jgi:hypothetical protein